MAHLCIRDAAGAVTCHVMTTRRTYRPIDSGATHIASNHATGCARMADATARCWSIALSDLVNGEPGYGLVSPAFAGPVATVTQLAVGPRGALALLEARSVTEWGFLPADGANGMIYLLRAGPAMQYSGAFDVAAIGAAYDNVALLYGDGAVAPQSDALSHLRGPDGNIPGLPSARAIAVGPRAVCAIARADDRVYCFGGAFFATPDRRFEAITRLDGAVELAVGPSHVCARMPDRTVRCTGSNDHGELGDGTTTPHPTDAVTVAGLTEVDQILAGHHRLGTLPGDLLSFTCARRRSEVLCWGAFPDRDPYMHVDHTTPTRIEF